MSVHDKDSFVADFGTVLSDGAHNKLDLSAFIVGSHDHQCSPKLLCLMTYKLTNAICICCTFQHSHLVLSLQQQYVNDQAVIHCKPNIQASFGLPLAVRTCG